MDTLGVYDRVNRARTRATAATAVGGLLLAGFSGVGGDADLFVTNADGSDQRLIHAYEALGQRA